MVISWLKLKSSTFLILFFFLFNLIQQFILILTHILMNFGGVKGVFHFVSD